MTTTRVAPQAALVDATYHKSTRSTGTGNCVAKDCRGLCVVKPTWRGLRDKEDILIF